MCLGPFKEEETQETDGPVKMEAETLQLAALRRKGATKKLGETKAIPPDSRTVKE